MTFRPRFRRKVGENVMPTGPLGHFCDSLHDLLAHVLMWSEISLAVLGEERAGRTHWSIEPAWETAEMGTALNRTGVEAGRAFPSALLIGRFVAVRDALAAEIADVSSTRWRGQDGLGAVLQSAMTPADQQPYVHAKRHLGIDAVEVAG